MTDVFTAVADPTRRTLLERLRGRRPRSLSALAHDLPMTRQAVTKHLAVLEDAGLVERWTEGRERMHALRATGLRDLADWLAPYEAEWDARLERLTAHLADDEARTHTDEEEDDG